MSSGAESSRSSAALVTAGGASLWTAIAGTGRRVLLVHGGPGLDHHYVLPLAHALGGAFEVWCPDLPGHGRSRKEGARPPGLRQLEDALERWVSHLPRFDAVIGHSLGAWLVREMARRGELDTDAIVLVSPPASGQSAQSSSLRRAARVTGFHSTEVDPRRELARHVAAECGGSLPDNARQWIDASLVVPVSRYQALVKNLHRRQTGPPRPFTPKCPVLVLAGSEDRTTPVDQASGVAARIEGARLEILDGLGHYPFLEDPERVAAAIRAFISLSG